MTDKPKPKIVEIVKSDYQPTKAELEEEFELDVPGDTVDCCRSRETAVF